jgi:hypothetical protein
VFNLLRSFLLFFVSILISSPCTPLPSPCARSGLLPFCPHLRKHPPHLPIQPKRKLSHQHPRILLLKRARRADAPDPILGCESRRWPSRPLDNPWPLFVPLPFPPSPFPVIPSPTTSHSSQPNKPQGPTTATAPSTPTATPHANTPTSPAS